MTIQRTFMYLATIGAIAGTATSTCTSTVAFLNPSRSRRVQVSSVRGVRSNQVPSTKFTFTSLNESSTSSSTSTSTARTSSTSSTFTSSTTTNNDDDTKKSNTSNKVAVLICPAQFCVPADYQSFIQSLLETKSKSSNTNKTNIVAAKVVPLPRTEWIKVARQLPTKSFLDGTLSPSTTLSWYFDAMEEALAELYANIDESTNICIISHSIGGWIARAYLGGLSHSSTAVYRLTVGQGGIGSDGDGSSDGDGKGKGKGRCTSLITLGSPHNAPQTALVDQTRGLLKTVENTYSCSSAGLMEEKGIQVTCVGSTAVKGSAGGLLRSLLSGNFNLDEIVALASYLPLVEQWNTVLFPTKSTSTTTSSSNNGDSDSDSDATVVGDGIIPKELAFMAPPAKAIEVQQCSITGNPVRHAHVLPTPWNLWDGYAKSIELPEDDYVWYGSDGVIDQWIDSIQ